MASACAGYFGFFCLTFRRGFATIMIGLGLIVCSLVILMLAIMYREKF